LTSVVLSNLIGTLAALSATDRPTVVGLDGRSGVGKSTLAASIAAGTSAAVIGGDDFFAGGTTLIDGAPEHLADLCIGRLRLACVLRDLRAGRPIAYRAFDWEAFDGRLEARATQVEPSGVILVEGVYSCHPDLHGLLDIKILATVSDEVRQARLKRREGEIGPWERQWHEAELWYFTQRMPELAFDHVIDTSI
jgi:uridine kinase